MVLKKENDCIFFNSEVHEKYHDQNEYSRWIRNREINGSFGVLSKHTVSFTVIVYIVAKEAQIVKKSLDSLIGLNYPYYNIIIINSVNDDEIDRVLEDYSNEPKVTSINKLSGGDFQSLITKAVASAEGEYIIFLNGVDRIEGYALAVMSRYINENPDCDIVYSDEDILSTDGTYRFFPFFKPDWSPDLFMCMNYIGQAVVFRAAVIKEVIGDCDFDIQVPNCGVFFKMLERNKNIQIGHVDDVLYHNRELVDCDGSIGECIEKEISRETDYRADYLKKVGICGTIEKTDGYRTYNISYYVSDKKLVSIIIPSKDNYDVLKKCIDSIINVTSYSNYEIVVVDNGSDDENKKLVSEYIKKNNGIFIYEKYDFNFSKMCNIGRRNSNGEYILFLNDDIEIVRPDWLEKMLGQAMQHHTGAVGAKLLYPQTRIIQHDGISNTDIGPCHNFIGRDDDESQYFSLNKLNYNCIAVTGACLMLATDKFDEIGGFDEKLPVAYNDVALCYALYEKGYYNVIRNDVTMYHYESLSRGNDIVDRDKAFRLERELKYLQSRFKELSANDPFVNSNLLNMSYDSGLKRSYDSIVNTKKIPCTKKGVADICLTQIGRDIVISGSVKDESGMNGLDEPNALVFADPYGKYYEASITTDANKACAFECKLEAESLSFDSVSYRMGIVMENKKGKRYIVWGDDSKIIGCHSGTLLQKGKKLNDYTLYKCKKDIVWGIGEFREEFGAHIIEGFAFIKNSDNCIYNKKMLLVGNNNVYEYDIAKVTRPDVAQAFPEQAFILNCGIVCNILSDELEDDEEYKLFLRFTNKYNDSDVCDVELCKKIEKR